MAKLVTYITFFLVRTQAQQERKPEDHVYYNTRDSIPVAIVSPTVTRQQTDEEEKEPRYVTTDDVITVVDDHYYSEATFTTQPTQDVYAVPNISRNNNIPDSDNDVTIVDNDVYTENHGLISPSPDENDVIIVDNIIYTEHHGNVSDTARIADDTHYNI